MIQCGVFKGTTRAHFVDRREFEGSVQEQMEAAYQYVLEKINIGMTIKGMYRKIDGEFGVDGAATQTPQTTQKNKQVLSDEDKTVLALVNKYPFMSQREYAMELGWTLDRVKYYVRKMKTQELIRRVGNSHSGYWEVLIEVNS